MKARLRRHYWLRITAVMAVMLAAYIGMVLAVGARPDPVRHGLLMLGSAAYLMARTQRQVQGAVLFGLLVGTAAGVRAMIDNTDVAWSYATSAMMPALVMAAMYNVVGRRWLTPPDPCGMVLVEGRKPIDVVLVACPDRGPHHWAAYSVDLPRVVPRQENLRIIHNLPSGRHSKVELVVRTDDVGRIWLATAPPGAEQEQERPTT